MQNIYFKLWEKICKILLKEQREILYKASLEVVLKFNILFLLGGVLPEFSEKKEKKAHYKSNLIIYILKNSSGKQPT